MHDYFTAQQKFSTGLENFQTPFFVRGLGAPARSVLLSLLCAPSIYPVTAALLLMWQECHEDLDAMSLSAADALRWGRPLSVRIRGSEFSCEKHVAAVLSGRFHRFLAYHCFLSVSVRDTRHNLY